MVIAIVTAEFQPIRYILSNINIGNLLDAAKPAHYI